jgi:hypothetical protein
LKYRRFFDSPHGTVSALRVGFGGRFGVKFAFYGLGRAACLATFDNGKRFK